jgi:uncharacterized membrane protein
MNKEVKFMKIDWKRKLTSRKFWVAIVGFVTPLLLAFGASEAVVTQVASIIMAGASCIAYIIGEGLADSKQVIETDTTEYDNVAPISFETEGSE